MLQIIKNNLRTILIILFVLSLLPFTGIFDRKSPEPVKLNEMFDPSLSRLNDPELLIEYTDSVFKANSPDPLDTSALVQCLSNTVKNRFYHHRLDYRPSDNWPAWALGKWCWSHIGVIVNPKDILKGNGSGFCSQQTMVFIDLLKRKGIKFRTVGLGYKEGPGHFLCEVWYRNEWHLHDVSIEPDWKYISEHHKSFNHYLANKDTLFNAYKYRMAKDTFDRIMEKHQFGEPNKVPAQNMTLLHSLLWWFSILLPVGLFGGVVYLTIRPARKTNADQPKRVQVEEKV